MLHADALEVEAIGARQFGLRRIEQGWKDASTRLGVARRTERQWLTPQWHRIGLERTNAPDTVTEERAVVGTDRLAAALARRTVAGDFDHC